MPLISIEEVIKAPPKGEVFVVDTNFIIFCSENSNDHQVSLAKNLKTILLENDCFLVYNVSTKNELLHHLREFQLNQVFKGNSEIKVNDSVKKAYEYFINNSNKSLSKWVLESGYGSILLEMFGNNGEKLKMLFDDLVEDFIYSSDYYENGTVNKSAWENVFKIMAEHALDSTDAMILNFGLSDQSFNGLISLDRDFNYCAKTGNFKILLPNAYISDKTRNKDWRIK